MPEKSGNTLKIEVRKVIYLRPHQLSLTQGIQQACHTVKDDLEQLRALTHNEDLQDRFSRGFSLVLGVLIGQLESLPRFAGNEADKAFLVATETYLQLRKTAEDLGTDMTEVLGRLKHPMVDYQVIRGKSLPDNCRNNMRKITHPERVAALATA